MASSASRGQTLPLAAASRGRSSRLRLRSDAAHRERASAARYASPATRRIATKAILGEQGVGVVGGYNVLPHLHALSTQVGE